MNIYKYIYINIDIRYLRAFGNGHAPSRTHVVAKSFKLGSKILHAGVQKTLQTNCVFLLCLDVISSDTSQENV